MSDTTNSPGDKVASCAATIIVGLIVLVIVAIVVIGLILLVRFLL